MSTQTEELHDVDEDHPVNCKRCLRIMANDKDQATRGARPRKTINRLKTMAEETDSQTPTDSPTGLPASAGSANTPLRVNVKRGMLTVEIGIKTLEWASKPENGGTLERCKVDGRRRREWAEDVAREMVREDEVGESPLMRFLDDMMEKAADNGSGALCWQNSL